MSKNPKYWWKLMKIANINREIPHIFWMTWGMLMKFSGKICLMIILKVTENHGFPLSLEDKFLLEKPQGRGGRGWGMGGGGGGWSWLPPAVLGLIPFLKQSTIFSDWLSVQLLENCNQKLQIFLTKAFILQNLLIILS